MEPEVQQATAGTSTDSLFVPIQEEPAPAAPQPDQATQPQIKPSDSLFLPVEQVEQRLQPTYDPEDVKKGAVAGIYEGVTRIPSAVSGLIRSGIDEVAYFDFKRQEEAGKIPSADEAFADYKLSQEQAAERSGIKKIPELAEEYLPYYGYEPQTRMGAMAKETAASGTETAALPFLGAGGIMARGFAGGVAGAFGEGMRQKFEGTPYEPYAQFAGAFGGQILGELGAAGAGKFAKGFKLFGVENEFENALRTALASDFKDDMLRMSPDDLAARIKSGEPITVGDVLKPGSRTGSLLEDMAAHVPGKKPDNFISQTLSEMAGGRSLDAGAIKTSLKDAAKDEADRVFDIARANPAANDITPADIGPWVNNPKIKRIMDDVAELSGLPTADKGRILKVPETIPGQPGTETKILQTERGLKEFAGTPAVPEQYVGGNLNFWQKVKERLGDEYARTGETAFLDAKNNLIKSLTKKVPEYGDALAATAEKYGNLDAMMDGYGFMRNINAMKIGDVMGKVGKMNEQQLVSFRDGVLSNIAEVSAQPGGAQRLYNQILEPNSNFSTKLKATLGEDQYNQIAGAIVQQNINNRAMKLSEKLMKAGETVLQQKGYVGAAASGAAALSSYLMGASVPTNVLLAGTAALLGGRQLAMNSLERKIAPLALEAIRDPNGGMRLAKLLQDNPEARTFLQKLNAGMIRASLAGARTGLSEQDSGEPLQPVGMPSPNAHGGRIAYKSGGRVKSARAVAEALMREIDQTRKMIGKKTEDILSLPDDAVATALKIARGNV